MNYIVFDLEFNQDLTAKTVVSPSPVPEKSHYPFEIIEIGAMKLDADNFQTLASFRRFVKPTIYTKIDPFITELTGITTAQLQTEELFPAVFQDFMEFIGGTDNILCIWGMSDIKELFRNADEHQLNRNLIPRYYINLQPYVSVYFKQSVKRLLGLQYTVEALGIPMSVPFHDALNDAYYTAEVLKMIYQPSMLPKIYEHCPTVKKVNPRTPKREINFDGLIHQLEKMYSRKMSEEEQGIIKLAYQMGKTNQFLK
ncbi:MAG TPA: 3'-5' exonuclease [Mobilitalea sp.]|nr:3'-5' exonuclease [Mobilitalea sp.]